MSGLLEKYNEEIGNPYYESHYFRLSGDMALEDPYKVNTYMNGIEEPSCFNMIPNGKDSKFNWELKNKEKKKFAHQAALSERRVRNANVEGIKNKYIPSEDDIVNEDKKNALPFLTVPNANVNRSQDLDPDHLGAFISYDQAGSRYIYGLPVMNKKDESYSFSVSSSKVIDNNNENINPGKVCGNTVEITPSTNSSNPHGIDYSVGHKYFEKIEVPAYAHSYLLTGIIGADYVDVTQNGISDDDLGYWVKFNYTKKSDNYKWRSPFNHASYIVGKISDFDDDKGYFTYGERENYYLESVETKTHIAEFALERRHDAVAVKDYLGGKNQNPDDAQSSFLLNQIQIFSKAEKADATNTNSDPVPMKTVHFDYSYELCPQVDNNDGQNLEENEGGKLTLKQLWFTYRNNNRGSLNKYYFDYDEDNDFSKVETVNNPENPTYGNNIFDCWGNYNSWLTDWYNGTTCSGVHPYVPQELDPSDGVKEVNNISAAAWSLKRIKTPSGAIINVKYEADDYAYVQNKRAMQMYRFSEDQGGNGNHFSKDGNGKYLWVDVPSSLNQDNYLNLFDYTGQLYFKSLIPLIGNSYHEYIAGYVEIDSEKMKTLSYSELVADMGAYKKIKLYLRHLEEGDKAAKTHPIRMAALDYLKYSRPELIPLLESGGITNHHDADETNDEGKKGKFLAFVSTLLTVPGMFSGFFNTSSGSALTFDPQRSFVRLNNLNGFKQGGGLRVKSVLMQESVGNIDNIYGQVYDYTTIDATSGKTISSGVATYEPQIGGEQNALKKAINYKKNLTLKSDLRLFMEYPYNESYFPGASVGYSKVTVKSLATHHAEQLDPNDPNFEKYKKTKAVLDLSTADLYDTKEVLKAVPTTGTIINEFYTAKDFPVYIANTELKEGENKLANGFTIPLLVFSERIDYMFMSQGFLIEINDMHGRTKRTSAYAQARDGSRVEDAYSSTTYHYKTKPVTINNEAASRLKNKVTGLFSDGSQKEMYLGLDYEFFMDVRASESRSTMAGANGNGDVVGVPPVTSVVASAFGNVARDLKRSRFVTTNKIIRRTGIVERVEVEYQNSKVSTENVVYDVQTGQPLLTKVQNNYNDPVYSLTIPGYWKYEGMGPAYKNLGLKFNGNISRETVNSKSKYYVESDKIRDIVTHLYPGDEFVVGENKEGDVDYKQGYVMSISEDKFELDFDGAPPETLDNLEFYLTRSGRRNLLSTVAGQVTSLKNPLNTQPLNCDEL